ncbi:hypothetical protein PIROE2DRAFT_21391 [Piromyces sp. E2]|nr:hypothetical protein PIROE2DRAFT_21391 [Piromyces sp. E2]|eukprot:OUM58232.1 hypothetical protein PIROE2DRAFT_21391 [Piromyces sp. E2]
MNDIQVDTIHSSILVKKGISVKIRIADVCSTNKDCKENNVCFNSKCYENHTNEKCDMDSIKECPKPYRCIDSVCQLPKEGNNFLFKRSVYRCASKYNINKFKNVEKQHKRISQNPINNNESNPSKEQNINKEIENKIAYQNDDIYKKEGIYNKDIYIKDIYNKSMYNDLDNKDDTYNKGDISNKDIYTKNDIYKDDIFTKNDIYKDDIYNRNNNILNNDIMNNLKINDPYTTVYDKKDYDIAGNTYPKTPQSGTTLINKSFSSTNNLIEKNMLHEKTSISNSYYRKYSGGNVSSLRDHSPSMYSNSFQDINTSNSFTNFYSPENKPYVPPYNTFNCSPIPPPAVAHHQSQSLSLPRKASPIESPNFSNFTNCHRTYASTSNQISFILESNEEDEDDEDNQTTLSFDSGVLKVSSSSFKKNKESIIYSYSEDLNASKECIVPSPETPTSNKKIIDN